MAKLKLHRKNRLAENFSKGGIAVKNKKEKRGVFVALGICLVAIGVASWGTYNSVTDYLEYTDTQQESAEVQEDDPLLEREATTQDTGQTLTLEESSETQDTAVDSVDEEIEEVEELSQENQLEQEDTAEIEVTEVATQSYSLSYSIPVSSSEIIQAYSGNSLVYNETMKDYRVHSGVDISASFGETVYSINSGLVKSCYYDYLLGNVVVIEHGDYLVSYCGLGDTFLVSEGETVGQNQAIGSVKEVPSENTSNHLHLEVWLDGVSIDPADLGMFD